MRKILIACGAALALTPSFAAEREFDQRLPQEQEVAAIIKAAHRTVYAWLRGDCGEYTPSGHFIRWVDKDLCREHVGSRYGWLHGQCREYTPGGHLIRFVDRSLCF